MKKPEEMSLVELKATHYDTIQKLAVLQNNAQILEELIEKKTAEEVKKNGTDKKP